MAPTGTPPAAITPQGIRDGDPAVLAALAAVRGPAVVAFAETVCEPSYVVRAAADAFARFRAAVADPELDANVHPDALLLRCARRAALDLAPRGPDLGCGPASDLLAQRAERTIKAADATLLNRHLKSCEHCSELAQSLDAADRAYREADGAALEPAVVAPMVAALAAAAPVRAIPVAAPANGGTAAVAVEPDPVAEAEPEAEAEAEPEPEAEAEPEAEPEPEPEAEAEPEAEPEDESETDEPEPEREIPIGTRRLTGAPASYYELPPLQPRQRGERAKKALSGAAAAGGLAASWTSRARKAARKRLDRTPPPVAPPAPAPDAEQAPEPVVAEAVEPVTGTWAPVESIEFPATPATAEPEPEPGPGPAVSEPEYDPLAPDDPELRETAARAAARHYRRLRHMQLDGNRRPADGKPPRLTRPIRDRGPHLPLSAHGPRDLALPAGLLVVAVLVVMAVSGVFGGGSSTPATGTQAKGAPETLLVSQSVTALSLADAERIAARSAAVTAP